MITCHYKLFARKFKLNISQKYFEVFRRENSKLQKPLKTSVILAQKFKFFYFQVKLERILGLTVPNNAALASAPSRGLVAYPAGCTVVLLNTRKNRQNHIINPSRKTITSLAFSEDGRYLVTGECGHAPCVRIWDVQERQQISEFPGHKYGVNVVAFAPNGKTNKTLGAKIQSFRNPQ